MVFARLGSCDDCGVDTLEDNDFVAGVDHVEGREPLEVAFCKPALRPRSTQADRAPLCCPATNKNGEPVCKKHSSTKDACFQFKKQIVAASKA